MAKTAESHEVAASKPKRRLSLRQQANRILAQAEDAGLKNNFFFKTTFSRYQEQLDILVKLEKAIEEYGPTVEKEYVKGRPNITINPAISEYNKTSTAANGTVNTLTNIIKAFANETDSVDKLSEFLKDEDG